MKPRVFVGSSVESLKIADAIQTNLDYDAEVTVWSDGIFKPSKYVLESLLMELANTDFGIFVLTPEDIVKIRDKEETAARDNVIFELGVFIGRLGRERTFFVVPRNAADFHLPSDLIGLEPVKYEANRSDGNLTAALRPACSAIATAIREQGARNSTTDANPSLVTEDTVKIISGPFTRIDEADLADFDENDVLTKLEDFFSFLAENLNLGPRTSLYLRDIEAQTDISTDLIRRYVGEAVKAYGYKVTRTGKETIVLEPDTIAF